MVACPFCLLLFWMDWPCWCTFGTGCQPLPGLREAFVWRLTTELCFSSLQLHARGQNIKHRPRCELLSLFSTSPPLLLWHCH
ncbi:hypothetical protein MHYP_G00339390 [Metynnis hypsauchen]